MGKHNSIYPSSEGEARLMAIYDARLQQGPGPFESLTIPTSYGKVHVIASGSQDAPSAVLLHAANLSAWSWFQNVEGLNKHYRTHAIDQIGDVGKSVLADLNRLAS